VRPKCLVIETFHQRVGDRPADPCLGAGGDVCCKWKLSMRDESDPDYVPVQLTKKGGRGQI